MVTRSYREAQCYEYGNDKTKHKQDKNSISRIFGVIYIQHSYPQMRMQMHNIFRTEA